MVCSEERESQECVMGRCACILQLTMQQQLDPQQYMFLLYFEYVAGDTQCVGDGLRASMRGLDVQ